MARNGRFEDGRRRRRSEPGFHPDPSPDPGPDPDPDPDFDFAENLKTSIFIADH